MSLDNLEKKLYGLSGGGDDDNKTGEPAGGAPKAEAPADAGPQDPLVSSDWQNAEPNDQPIMAKATDKIGKAAKIIFWLMMAAVIGAGGFLYYYFSNYLESKDFTFNVSGPERIMVGESFEITVSLENRSKSAFRDPQILIRLPEGIMSLEGGAKKQIIEDDLENMAPGEMAEKKYRVAALQDPRTSKSIKALFSYLPENINTRFEKEKELAVSLDDPVVDLSISAPQKVFSGENFEINVKYKNISRKDISGATLKLDYPAGFTPKEFSENPTTGNNIWTLPVISSDREETISIKGVLAGFEESFFEIKGRITIPSNGDEFAINEKSANLSIAPSPLSLSIAANSNPQFVARPKERISYTLAYKNNTDVNLSDAVIKAQLKGDMFDFSGISTNGSFDFASKTITWNAANAPELRDLAPGAEGAVNVSIAGKDSYPIKRMFDKNFTLKISGEISSPTVPYNVSSDKTVGQATLTTKVAGDFEVNVSSVKNIGPYPPQAGRKTTYTIYIRVKNYATDLSDFKFTGMLSPESKLTGNIKTNSGSEPQVNDRTGEIIWGVPSIVATKGVISSPMELSFQIENTPSVTQIGREVELLSNMQVSATDAFIGQSISKNIEPLRTDERIIK